VDKARAMAKVNADPLTARGWSCGWTTLKLL
jgi:hypothetical protein